MAYVAISSTLKENVQRTIEVKRQAEKKLVPGHTGTTTVPGTDPFFLEKAWGEHLHLMSVVPNTWCRSRNDAVLTSEWQLDLGEGATAVQTTMVSVNFTPPMVTPPTNTSYTWTVEVPNDHPLISAQVEHDKQCRLIHAKWDKVWRDLSKFLNSCKSLNEALKLWPDLRVYVPQSYLDKVEEKTAKARAAESKAMEILKSIDTDGAIANAVMVRMMTASTPQE